MNYNGQYQLDEIEKDIIGSTEEIDDVEELNKKLESLEDTLGVDFDQNEETYENPTPTIDNMYDNIPTYKDNYMNQITDEEKKKKILGHVLSGIDNSEFSVEKEKEEDDKTYYWNK